MPFLPTKASKERKARKACRRFFSPNAPSEKPLVSNLVKIQLPRTKLRPSDIRRFLYPKDRTLPAELVSKKVFDKIPVRGHSSLQYDFWEAVDLFLKNKRISKKHKTVITLYVGGGYHMQEVADKLHISRKYAEQLLRQTLAALAEYFAEDFGYIYTKSEEKPTLRFAALEIPDTLAHFIPGDKYR